MKNTLKFLAFLVFLALTNLGCKKSDLISDPTKGFSTQIQNIVSKSLIDSIRVKGMTINEGTVPPNVSGIFLESPTIVVATFAGDTDEKYKVGSRINDYTYKFYEPSADNSIIKVAYKSSTEIATGLGSFVSGNGNKFTIFSELKSNDGNTYINIISGELSATGIMNWQDTYVNKSTLTKIRIYKDGDGLA
jgi:hypothetical protein